MGSRIRDSAAAVHEAAATLGFMLSPCVSVWRETQHAHPHVLRHFTVSLPVRRRGSARLAHARGLPRASLAPAGR